MRESFARAGIRYEDATIRDQDGEPTYLDKSRAYLEVEPLFATGNIRLLDHPTLIRQLKNLERRNRAGGKALIDHPSGQHDDYSNALCLAAAKARHEAPGASGARNKALLRSWIKAGGGTGYMRRDPYDPEPWGRPENRWPFI